MVSASKPAALKLLASKVKIYKPEEVDIPAMVTSSRMRPGTTSYKFQKRFSAMSCRGATWFWTSVLWKLQGHPELRLQWCRGTFDFGIVNDTILAISRAEDIPSEVLECFVLYRFWPDTEREESVLKVVEIFLSRID
ncbi:hypothetical protein B0H14DRAFT_2617650 [Mycena olivaceomarginata]|nr:hypothetical protein B0H14DRAFT_2617650 [Mycena olivaceomarginata]